MANNDFPHMLALQAAQAGLGILFCPISLGHNILRRGEQIQVLPEWQGASREIYAVWSQQRYVPARVQALIEHLADFCQQDPLLIIFLIAHHRERPKPVMSATCEAFSISGTNTG